MMNLLQLCSCGSAYRTDYSTEESSDSAWLVLDNPRWNKWHLWSKNYTGCSKFRERYKIGTLVYGNLVFFTFPKQNPPTAYQPVLTLRLSSAKLVIDSTRSFSFEARPDCNPLPADFCQNLLYNDTDVVAAYLTHDGWYSYFMSLLMYGLDNACRSDTSNIYSSVKHSKHEHTRTHTFPLFVVCVTCGYTIRMPVNV